MHTRLILQISLILSLFAAGPAIAQEKACLKYRHYPLPGHPVTVVDIHPSDKNYPFLSELSTLKMILLEPGICETESSGKNWFRGRIFVFKSRSANFSHGEIILIQMGRFK